MLRPSAITVPLGHFTWYVNGQSAPVGGVDQSTTTSGGVATWRLGLTAAPGQAEGEMVGRGMEYRSDHYSVHIQMATLLPGATSNNIYSKWISGE